MKSRLITPSYCSILAASFLLYSGFWLLMPVLPSYLSEVLSTSNPATDIILSCYAITTLCIHPFSDYLLDGSAHKPLYLLVYSIPVAVFAGYVIAGSLALFIPFRVIHGISFDMVTMGGNTVVIDIMPSSRRGEGLGYYGLSNNITMAVGPMSGLFLHNAGMSYTSIFCCSLGSCIAGLICTSLVKTPYKPPVKREPISLDRFILLKNIPAGISLLLLSIPYRMIANYVAMYTKEIGINATTGFFFTFMAVDMAILRISSDKIVDRGKTTQVISTGLYVVIFSFFLLSSCTYIISWNGMMCSIIFFTVALLLGIGFGIIFSAYNTLFVNLAPSSQRGTATSAYLASWGIGIGIDMLAGEYITEVNTFDKTYLFGTCLIIISMFCFDGKVAPHYHKNKLR